MSAAETFHQVVAEAPAIDPRQCERGGLTEALVHAYYQRDVDAIRRIGNNAEQLLQMLSKREASS